MQIPLARPVAVIPARRDRPVAASEDAPVQLRPEHVAWKAAERLRPTPDRATGLILGQRVAEAAALEGMAGREGTPAETNPVAPGPVAREVAVLGELALRGPVSPRRVAAALVAALSDPQHPAHGWLAGYRASGNWRDAGTAGVDAAPALRAIPLSVILADDPAALVVETVSTAIVTHRDIRAVAGAVTLTWAVREALSGPAGRSFRTVDYLENIGARCRSIERVLVRRLGDLLVPTWRENQHVMSTLLYRAIALADGRPETVVADLRSQVPRAAARGDEGARRADETGGEAAIDGTLAVPLGLLLACICAEPFPEALQRICAIPGIPIDAVSVFGAVRGARGGEEAVSGVLGRAVTGAERASTLARALAGDPLVIREARV